MDKPSVSIRPCAATDLDTVAAWLSRPDTNRWLFSQFRGQVVDARMLKPMTVGGRNRLYIVLAKASPCGIVGLSSIDAVDLSAMIWYALGDRSLGGRGIMSQAVAAVTRLAFTDLRLRSLHATAMAANESSIRLLDRIGYRRAGVFRQSMRLGSEFVDGMLFDAVPNDFLPPGSSSAIRSSSTLI
jgi:RimJ/RimL family protein N-acetyltransferase